MRRANFNNITQKFIAEKCDDKNNQKSNLTKAERRGLKTLQKRAKGEEIVVMSTDKSCKLAVTTMENYLEMGRVHTRNDKEISREEFAEMEKIVNGHTAMHIKMQGMGENWGHTKRMRGTAMTRSQNLASLRLLLKDRKKQLKTRQVVSGCDSNTVGLSNIMSDLIESIANAIENPHETISTEDMLSKITECNRELEKRRLEREANGEELDEDEKELYILGSDVVALFPSMTGVRTGRVCREQAVKSSMMRAWIIRRWQGMLGWERGMA
jgi:molybdopterin converting factor small subunit